MALRCDLIIRDATVFDGTGAPRSRPSRRHRRPHRRGRRPRCHERDARSMPTGLALAPGFIDAHTHDDRAVLCGPACMLCKMSQGVTTVVVGNCGISLSPVRMQTRPIPPLDLLGDELVRVRQFRRIRRTPGARSVAGEHLRADRPHVAAGRGDGRRHPTRRHRQARRRTCSAVGQALAAGRLGLFHRAVLSAEHDGADR